MTKKSLLVSVSMQAISKIHASTLKSIFPIYKSFLFSEMQVSPGYVDCMWSSTLKQHPQIIVSMYMHIFCSLEEMCSCVPPGCLGHLNLFNLTHVRLVLLWGHKHEHDVAPRDVLMLLEAFFQRQYVWLVTL